LAELCSQLLSKGRKIYTEGRIQTRKWTGQDGQERTTVEIVMDDMMILDSKRSGEEGGQSNYEYGAAPRQPSAPAQVTQQPVQHPPVSGQPTGQEEVNVDDIPF
jgi:single-strand DNA-binding protein